MKICGIDEAGRGPVIGPMVMAGVVIKNKDWPKIRKIGFKDSKKLTPLQRRRLYAELMNCDFVERFIRIVHPQEIDAALNSESSNLNLLEVDVTTEIIANLLPDVAVVDSPSHNTKAYAQDLARILVEKTDKKIKLITLNDAERHTLVAAASVLAKVTRDKLIEDIKKEIGIDFGSGYPADPKTRAFLQKYYNKFPHIFRKTWKSYTRVAQPKEKKLSEF